MAEQMAKYHEKFPFDFVIMLGDNIYGGDTPGDYKQKFELPYKTLLDAGVKFYASLGNHDNPNERLYSPFNMSGERYYTFKKGNVGFFALDSTYMNPAQLAWIEQHLHSADSGWKICFFHHPLYSDGKGDFAGGARRPRTPRPPGARRPGARGRRRRRPRPRRTADRCRRPPEGRGRRDRPLGPA